MATADQIKTLIKSHVEHDDMRFSTVALQIAAHEARQGHAGLANEIKILVNQTKSNVIKLKPFNDDMYGLIMEIKPKYKFSNLFATKEVKAKIDRVLIEFKQRDKLRHHGLSNRRKILLSGAPGTGKTLTASIFAKELQLPFYVILMDKLVTKFMGETSVKMRHLFDAINERPGVYLFDEFDAIGGERGQSNDVGEMRRVLNSFLQMIEQDESNSLIVAATNTLQSLDPALFRRFDDVIHYDLPTGAEGRNLVESCLGNYKGLYSLNSLKLDGLSHAEITQACKDAIKQAILGDKKKVSLTTLKNVVQDKQLSYNR